MPLLNDLLDFSDHPLMPPPSAQLFAEHLPVEWIQHCLTLSAHAIVRCRRLPGDMVIWMVVAMAFFRNEPITDVVHRLNLSADGEAGMTCWPAALSPRRVSAWGPPRWNGSSARPHRHGARNVT